MTHLIYETTSDDFADRVLDTLRKAEIPCSRTGGMGYTSSIGLPTGENPICLFVSNEADVPRANEILLSLGADTSGVSLTQFKWIIRFIAVFIICAVVWLLYQWVFATDL